MSHRYHWGGATAVLAALATLCSCTVGPNFTAPQIVVPSRFGPSKMPESAAKAYAKEGLDVPVRGLQPLAKWWTSLYDTELNRLVRRAEEGNLSLAEAASRLAQSRAALRIAGAQSLPTLDAAGGYARIETGRNPSFGGLAGNPGGAGNSGGNTTTSSKGAKSSALSRISAGIFNAGFTTNWEIDLFGGQRRKIEAARADYEASVEDRRNLSVSIVAEVARDYLQLRGSQERLRIAQANLVLQQETLSLTQSLRRNGFSSEFDESRAKTQVAQTRAAIVPLRTACEQEEHAIEALLGLYPNALSAELAHPAPPPRALATLAMGTPADLLRRRPDVRRAERQIAAANARVGAAVADFFPKFSLTGAFGLDSSKFEHLFDYESRYLLIYPNVDWRIFDFGRTAAQVEQEKARTQEALLSYKGIVLAALREVEDALDAYSGERTRYVALEDAAKSAQESASIAKDQYKQGLSGFLPVLDAQRQLLSVQDQLAESGQETAIDLVALYKALGGGWEASTDGAH